MALGGTNYLEAWTADYQVGYSRAEQDTPSDQTVLFVGEAFTLGYDGLGEEIGVFGGPGTVDPANYELDEISLAGSLTEDEEWSYRFDLTRDLSDMGYPGTVQFGAKVRLREKTSDADETLYDGFPEDTTLADGFAEPVDDYDLRAPFVGPAISPGAADRYIAANRAGFEVDDEETLIASVGDDYTVEEDVYAVYAMSRAEFGRLRVVGGLRFERTELDAEGTAIVVTEDGPELVEITSGTEYDDLLPSITFRYELAEDRLLRFAASRTISRPEIGDIAPRAEIAFTRRFAELPAPFDGLLVSANATFSDSEANIAQRDDEIDLPLQSDIVANLIVGYEKGPLSMRLSSTFTGERLEELVEPDDPSFDRYQSDHFQMDFAAFYDLTDSWQLQFEVVNINDEPFYANFGKDDRFNSQYEQYGRTYALGLRYEPR